MSRQEFEISVSSSLKSMAVIARECFSHPSIPTLILPISSASLTTEKPLENGFTVVIDGRTGITTRMDEHGNVIY